MENKDWHITAEEYIQFKKLRKKIWMEDIESRLEGMYDCAGEVEKQAIDKILESKGILENMAGNVEGERSDVDADVSDQEIIDYVIREWITKLTEEEEE